VKNICSYRIAMIADKPLF